jgi:hypothetical protein
MSSKDFVKSDYPEILLAVAFAFLPFFLLPNLWFSVFAALLILGGDISLLFLAFKEEDSLQKTLASYAFFSSFLSGIRSGIAPKTSYDFASKYLVGKMEIKGYEELAADGQCPYPLGAWKTFFLYVLKRDQEGQALLPNYTLLAQETETKVRLLSSNLKKYRQDKLAGKGAMLAFFTLISFIVLFFPAIQECLSIALYQLVAALLLAVALPAVDACYGQALKGMLSHA